MAIVTNVLVLEPIVYCALFKEDKNRQQLSTLGNMYIIIMHGIYWLE